MEKKVVYVSTVTSLLLAMLMLGFHVQPINAEGTTIAAPVIVDSSLTPGTTFIADITAVAGDAFQPLDNYDFKLSYDTSILTAIDCDSYPPFSTETPGYTDINDAEGYVYIFAWSSIGWIATDPTPIAWIEFVVDDWGASSLNFDMAEFRDYWGEVITIDEVINGYFSQYVEDIPEFPLAMTLLTSFAFVAYLAAARWRRKQIT